jgi:hypothetical protein
MTKQSRDGTGTQFSHWLRKQPEIDSINNCFRTTNIDFVWQNYKSGLWMIIEEKRNSSYPEFPQTKLFELLHNSINDENYQGFYYLIFSNSSPENGHITLYKNFDKKSRFDLTKEQLIEFLRFKLIL